MNTDVAIIGAGAAGLMAAITCARKNKKVILIESSDKLGKKILVTGNGKCNMTNLVLDSSCYHSSSQVNITDIINLFGNKDIIGFFEEIGLLTRERDGYVYPYNESAQSVADALIRKVYDLEVNVWTGTIIKNIEKSDKKFIVSSVGKEDIVCNSVIIATGSNAGLTKLNDPSGYTYAKNFGHNLITFIPSLCPVICKNTDFKEFQGVRSKCKVTLFEKDRIVKEEYGEIQFTDYGLSGIPIFQLSADAGELLRMKKVPVISVDLVPEMDVNRLTKYIESIVSSNKRENIYNLISGIVNRKLSNFVLKNAGIEASAKFAKLGEDAYTKIAKTLKCLNFTVTDTKAMKDAQVCRGGVDLNEINPLTMESKLIKNLFFAGEIVDVDGKCGGYNLTWAFSTGHTSGENA